MSSAKFIEVQGVKDVLDASDCHNTALFLPTFIYQSTSKYSIGLEVLRGIPGGAVVPELSDCQTGTLVVCRHHTPKTRAWTIAVSKGLPGLTGLTYGSD